MTTDDYDRIGELAAKTGLTRDQVSTALPLAEWMHAASFHMSPFEINLALAKAGLVST